MANRIEQSVHIDAEPGVIFEALTTPELVQRWLCHGVEVEPRVGGRFDMHWSAEDQGAAIRYDGSAEITAFEAGRRLTLRVAPEDGPGPDSSVDISIESANGASDLMLIQTGFGDDEPSLRVRDAYQRGWQSCLAVLRSLLEDEPSARLRQASMHRDVRTPGHDPCGIAWDGDSLWVSDAGRSRIFRIDPLSGRTRGSFAFEGEPSGLAFDGESLWQGDREARCVIKLGTDGKVQKRLEPAQGNGELTGVAWDGQCLWVGDGGEFDGQLFRVQPRSGVIYQKLQVPAGVSGLAWDGTSLWLAHFEERILSRLDPRTGEILGRVAVKGHPTGLTWDGERLWYADAEWKLVSRILDPLT